jgi:hypothetical protein
LPVSFEPLVELAERLGLEAIDPLAAMTLFADKPGRTQNAQMPGDRRTADGEQTGDLIDGARSTAELIEDGSARGISDGVKDLRGASLRWQ